jgi:hypothetical protein
MYDFGALAEKYKQELFDNVVHFGGSNVLTLFYHN